MSFSEGSEDTRDEHVSEEVDYEEAGKFDKNESYAEEAVPKQALTREIIAECISMPYRLGYGFSHAFVKLDCTDRHLSDVNILREYIHLRFVILSNNFITDICPVSVIGHLIYLKADNNQISNAECLNSLKYLQFLDLSGNKLDYINHMNFQYLQHLKVNDNMIESLNGAGQGLESRCFPVLHTLELRGNRLKSLVGIGGLSSVKSLYCADNQLQGTEGIGGMSSLVRLHLRDNEIKYLPDFQSSMVSLEYLNLRGNRISRFSTIKSLTSLPALKILSLIDNPICDKADYRLMVIGILQPLQRLDKQRISENERSEGNALWMSRQYDEEEPSDVEVMEENHNAEAMGEGGEKEAEEEQQEEEQGEGEEEGEDEEDEEA